MLRIQLDGPAVTLDDVTHDGQAEASTSGDGLAGLVDAVEALEDLGRRRRAECGGRCHAGDSRDRPRRRRRPRRPDVEATDFVKAIDNPYLPFVEGAEWVYEGEAHGERERIDVVVTAQRRQVMGVSATVVVDRAFVNDELVEETADWYAQDVDGNVWYLGEDTVEYEGGEAVSTDGSWEAGVDGALPGIVMPAQPEVGLAYRQEFLAGEAEDMGEVIRTGERLATGMDTFADVLTTEDWTPLEPDVVEEKSYAPGVGLIRETKVAGDESVVELIEYTPPE